MDPDSGQTYTGLHLAHRYQLTEMLAQGALCAVYRGNDIELRRPIVVKAVPSAYVATYRAALRATASLTHPAAVAVYDAIDREDALFLVEEFVPSYPLSVYIEAEMPVERVLALMGQLARAVGYAHAQGIVHGDLSPAAVLVDRQATIRVNNFALPPDDAYVASVRRQLAASAWRTAAIPGAASQVLDGAVDARAADGATFERPAEATGTPHAHPAVEPPDGEAGDVWAIAALLWQSVSVPIGAKAAGRQFRAGAPNVVRALVYDCLYAPEAERVSGAEALADRLEAASAELARFRPSATPATPPALRAARDAVADMGLWAEDEPVFAAPARARQRIQSPDPSDFSAPTDPAMGEAVGDARETQPAQPFGDSPGAPLFPLPARLRDEARVGVAHPDALADARADAFAATTSPASPGAPAQWQVRTAWPEAERASGRVRLNLPTVIALGVILFVIFFIIGYMAPSLFAR